MKKIISLLFSTLIGTLMLAQNITVSGSVKDTKGEPVVGAVIMLSGNTRYAAMSDLDGNYTISIPASEKASLNVSCVSYKTQDVKVGTRSKIDFVLEDDNEMLDEVVVVGYGAMKRSDLTGSVASVKIDENKSMKSSTIDQMMEGKLAGVQVLNDSGSPDSGVTMRIRGIATFSGNSDPLYVVDGIIINGVSETIATLGGTSSAKEADTSNGLAGLNPQDIASIEVLKDASATAIYGSQGANGVVLITTKQANKDKPVINFNAGASISQASTKIDVLDFDQFVYFIDVYPTRRDAEVLLNAIYKDPDNHAGLKVTPVDWYDYSTRNALSKRAYFSVTGKPKDTSYLFSLGYNSTEGVLKGAESENITARLNLVKNITKHIKMSFVTNLSYTDSNKLTGTVEAGSPMANSSLSHGMLFTRPYKYQSLEEEEKVESVNSFDSRTYSPQLILEESKSNVKRFRVTPSIKFEGRIVQGVSFTSVLGGDFNSEKASKARTEFMSWGLGNVAGIGTTWNYRFNWDNMIHLSKTVKKHRLSATIGESMSMVCLNDNTVYGEKLPQKHAEEHNINFAPTDNSFYTVYNESRSSLMSFYTRLYYTYGERYIITSTFRADGSSKFKRENKWSFFPSFAFAWRIANEPWFKVPCISNMKLRLGWGQTGNQAIMNYQTGTTYTSMFLANNFNDTGKQIGTYPENIPNPGLKWETSTQWNVGLDYSMFKGRIALTADAYVKDTRDLLQYKNISLSTGYNYMYVNDGNIRNSGIEFTLDTVPVKTKKFEWTIGGNISMNRNVVTSIGSTGSTAKIFLSPDAPEAVQCNYFLGEPILSAYVTERPNIFIEGESMGLFYGYIFDGIVQEGEEYCYINGVKREAGLAKYKDLNNNGYVDEGDKTIIGNPHPKFTYGFNTSLSLGNFSLRFDFTGAYKFDMANFTKVKGYYTGWLRNNVMTDAVLKAWTPENKSNEWPKIGAQYDNNFCTRYVEDASYLRLSNIALSYDVPINRKKSKILQGMSAVFSVGNAFVWTKYSGYSPLNNTFGRSVKRLGVDLYSAPFPRSYNLDLKFTF